MKSRVEENYKSSRAALRSASAKLLGQPMALDYLLAQTERVAQAEQTVPSSVCSALIFRLGAEWLALPADLFQQVLSPLSAHSLPHRSNATLLGVINVKGQLLLKVSLLSVLGLEEQNGGRSLADKPEARSGYRRTIVVSQVLESGGADVWAFDVDEIYGIQAVPFDDLQPVTASVATAADTCTRYLFDWQDKRISFLDNIKLFDLVRKQAL